MSVYDEQSGSRPPPRQQRAWQLTTPGIPFYRDLRVLRLVVQVVFAILFIGGLVLIWVSLTGNLAESNVALDFNIYKSRFGAGIPEGLDFNATWDWAREVSTEAQLLGVTVWAALWLFLAGWIYRRVSPDDQLLALIYAGLILLILPFHSYAVYNFIGELPAYLAPTTMTRAIITGIYNTLKVVLISVVASTVLGVLVGIGLLSKNFLLRNTAKVFTEIFRNTPLLVQLIFIYQAALLVLPEVRNSITSPDRFSIFGETLATFYERFYVVNVRGVYLPEPIPTDAAPWFYGAIVIGLAAVYLIRRWRLQVQEDTGQPAYTWYFAIPAFILIALAGWWLAGGFPGDGGPFEVEYPAAGRFNIEGGTEVTMFFISLFIGLTLYTSAFIADIVRAGIQSVPYGQIEAARSMGLKGPQVLSMIILPQALRLIIPPLGNQYVNLGKNSSLGLVVGYADTYQVVQLANNESGQSVPFFIGLMIIYLLLSLTFSVLTNMLNVLTKVKAR